ncbi:MAG: metallophosphoesterase family protein [Oscillospiraceae bacterium]|nr:metallophosphoesterase family protein [Oscillospiraceae bacterium]MDD6982195.1 metallophosphoesterase family protein [Oscillospiraceae bacterium]MDY4624645.1 metallophosphoesterase family protein [Oscillospiraceae bacterium]
MLRFNSDHKFKIMQIADTQEIPAVSPDTLSLINNALDREKPDLVIFTGDQIKGYSKKFKKDPAIIESTIDILVDPIAKRNIPFMVTYGNHDAQCGVDNRGQYKFYAKYDNFISGDLRNADDVGTADIQIYSSTEDKPVFELYIIDSHGKAKDGAGYAPVDKKQIEWYVSRREQLKAENGDYLPSLVFQHIPVPEFFDVIKKVPKGTKGAVPAYGAHENEYFVLNDETIAEGGFMLESPASPDVNTGEFEAMSEKGDVLGIYVGHDHNNSFVVKYKGVDLGYTQGAGFNVYGPGENRGVRIFELDETAPREYKTYTMTFKELCGTKIKTPVKEFIYKHAPTSPRAVKPILIKIGIGIAAIAAVYAAYKFFTGFNI